MRVLDADLEPERLKHDVFIDNQLICLLYVFLWGEKEETVHNNTIFLQTNRKETGFRKRAKPRIGLLGSGSMTRK